MGAISVRGCEKDGAKLKDILSLARESDKCFCRYETMARVGFESYGDRKPRRQFRASLQCKSFFVVALNNLSAAMIGLGLGGKPDLMGVPYFARETVSVCSGEIR
ncbi:hypothetical protein CDAR_475301 [Caerostris darwini]|uniref:Uncharacterized protein n=1 Tax=Caerostris darwini TaxID=1538125 RepID=A0AAV4V5F9_9ARAC|nr:hypothetical protein CDAR_475301 [Caerostris darwini]